ncbi:Protease prsW [Dermatophilus congolensis]|uniref:Protease prsW n=1 Tax=Dermatophilus congolensis TaxID=1863 RepID=A0AA46H040_9MICO|nr:PrsW family intramembrane metalloprotease [Dermatophilus congolensis]STD07026.1 Protease prsW [Dermatophilus congolensis]
MDQRSTHPTTTQTVRAQRSRRQRLRRGFVFAAVLLAFGVTGWLLPTVIGLELGGATGLLALTVSLLPVGIVMPLLLWLDAYEAEPPAMVMLAFLWGAVIATGTALALNTGSTLLLASATADPDAVSAVLVAPIVEESLKGAGLLFILFWRREEFDGIIDGIVYAGVIACGFAFAENILYLGRAFNENGTEGLVAVFVIRGLISPFAHPLFTGVTGVALGWSLHRGPLLRCIIPPLGLCAAMTLHAAWNLSSVTGAGGFWSAYLVFQMPIFAAFTAFAIWVRVRERGLIRSHLTVYADYGWISPAEVRMLTSISERRTARSWAHTVGGREGKTAMRDFQDDAVELAMLRRRMTNGSAGPGAPAEERRLLEAMTAARAVLG